MKKQERELEETTIRLEGRINRSREQHEAMILMMKDEQIKFQTEVRNIVMDLNKGPTKNTEVTLNSSGISGVSRLGDTKVGDGGISGKGVLFGGSSNTGYGYDGGTGGGISMGQHVNGGGANWRFKKLDMPLFDGVNPDGWILRAERYHQFYRLIEEDKLEAAIVALEGMHYSGSNGKIDGGQFRIGKR